MGNGRQPSRTLELLLGFALTNEDIWLTDHLWKIKSKEIPAPIAGSFEQYLFFNSGNLFSGFEYAFLCNLLFEYGTRYFYKHKQRAAIASGVMSAAAIIFFETTGIGNIPDIRDIPAGIAGAGLYIGVRYVSIYKSNFPNCSAE